MRILRTCREMGIAAIALYSPVDKDGLWIRLADEAYEIESYLNLEAILKIAKEAKADAIHPGERVILVDDLIATGGTAEGAVKLMRQIGANVVAACFIIDLPDLGGAAKLRAMDVPVRTLMTFDGH